jgi:hypothetical protein
VNLAMMLSAAVNNGTAARSLASAAFFQSPDRIAERQVAEALAAKPTLVFAIDYLFWHAYGLMNEQQRPELFERGLDRLDRLLASGVTVVVGDLPNMAHAAPGMLTAAQVPSAEMHLQLNARLAEWAAGRPKVRVIGLAELVRAARAGEALTMGGHTYGPGEAKKLLQRDGLHATGAGLAALAQESLRLLQQAGAVPEGSWQADPAQVLASVRPRRRTTAGAGASPKR